MDFRAQQGGEAGGAEAARIGNGEIIARHEMIGQRHEIIATTAIGLHHILRRALAVRKGGMGMDIALEEAPRRGEDGIKLHRALLHSDRRNVGQRIIHWLPRLREARNFLIRAFTFPTKAQHGIAAFRECQ